MFSFADAKPKTAAVTDFDFDFGGGHPVKVNNVPQN
jgi:hypothetical protein